MHVIGNIRGDEVEARDSIVDEILRQFRIGADMVGAVLEVISNLVEEYKRVMPDYVGRCVRVRHGIARNILLIGLP